MELSYDRLVNRGGHLVTVGIESWKRNQDRRLNHSCTRMTIDGQADATRYIIVPGYGR